MAKRNLTRQEREQRRRRFRVLLQLAGLLVGSYLLLSLLFGNLGLLRYYKMHQLYYQTQQEVEALEREHARLRQEVEDLKTDPQTIERIARERLGMAREGEIVFQFPHRVQGVKGSGGQATVTRDRDP
ncbi:MAG: septum formation initiator family protein [Nitrospirae bacterium]|nr:septum formation initiator family protein [Nitrospirota bacterium]